jgi:hypothetical protein
MADARALIAVLALAAIAAAEPPCEEARSSTGLALARRAEGLVVVAVDAGTPAATAGVQAGDVVVQTNERLAATCSEYARAVRDARRGGKALLLLVRRAGAETALALRPTPAAPAAVAAAEGGRERTGPRTPPPPPAPEPLPADVPVSVEGVIGGLEALAPVERAPRALPTYQRDLTRIEREIETLATRGTSADALAPLRAALAPYRAAGVAWEAAERASDQERRPRRFRGEETQRAPYFEDSPEAAVLAEFPALRETVVREPRPGVIGESSGLWLPLVARGLLWERGRRDVAALRAHASGTP